jgi:hypothetical protein
LRNYTIFLSSALSSIKHSLTVIQNNPELPLYKLVAVDEEIIQKTDRRSEVKLIPYRI